jgi:Pyrimidine dimer DNA glycosylase
MQTFLPYKDFVKIAKCLDYKRLGKQRIEARDILYLCYRHRGADKRKQFNKSDKQAEYLWVRYRNHPAVLMWVDSINCLKLYYNTMVNEWVRQGYNNTQPIFRVHGKIKPPIWFNSRKLYSSHRANLLRKDFNFYSKYGWKEQPTKGYYWPIRKENYYV